MLLVAISLAIDYLDLVIYSGKNAPWCHSLTSALDCYWYVKPVQASKCTIRPQTFCLVSMHLTRHIRPKYRPSVLPIDLKPLIRPSFQGYTSQQEYIATQGPVAETKNDFWRMIWEQDIEIIVMLTKRIESGKVRSS